jgi:hypothetical protein
MRDPGSPSYGTAGPGAYRPPAPRAPAPSTAAGPPIYTNYNQNYPQQTHITTPGGRTTGNVPGAGPSGATQARQDAAAAAAYARQLQTLAHTRWNANGGSGAGLPNITGSSGGGQGGSFGGGLNGSGTNLPNINTPSGGGSGIPGGGQGGPSANFSIPKAPKAPALDTYLRSDAAYQNQLRTFAQALAEFQSGQQRTTAQDNTSWQGATRQLGDQKVKDLAGIMNDFASRGMLKSGLYGQGIADYTKTYQNNLNDLNTGHTNALRDLSTANVNFQKDQAIQSAQARADAASRRAAQFGL